MDRRHESLPAAAGVDLRRRDRQRLTSRSTRPVRVTRPGSNRPVCVAAVAAITSNPVPGRARAGGARRRRDGPLGAHRLATRPARSSSPTSTVNVDQSLVDERDRSARARCHLEHGGLRIGQPLQGPLAPRYVKRSSVVERRARRRRNARHRAVRPALGDGDHLCGIDADDLAIVAGLRRARALRHPDRSPRRQPLAAVEILPCSHARSDAPSPRPSIGEEHCDVGSPSTCL